MPATPLQKYLLTWTCISLRILIVTSAYNLVVFLTSPDHKLWEIRSILPAVILLHHGLRYVTSNEIQLVFTSFSVWYLPFNPVLIDWLLISGEFASKLCRIS